MELWNGDCLVEMSRIADGSVDFILCDLPYQVTQNAWNTGREFIGIEKDPEYFRIASERIKAAQDLPREYPMFEAA